MTEQPRKARTKADVRRAVGVETQIDARQLLEQAVGLHQAGDPARAATLYEQVLEREPRQPDALHFLGLARFQLGDGERAVALIRRAIEQRPAVAAYHDNLGSVHEARGELADALTAYDEAERLEPGNAERRFNVGIVLDRLGRAEAAEQAYRAAIALSPGEHDFHYNLGVLLAAQGRLEDAVAAYRAALEARPGAAACWNNLGNALRGLGRRDEAASAYRSALEARPGDALTHLNLGHCLREDGDLEGARDAFAQALVRAGDDGQRLEARLALAAVDEALGDHARALEGSLAALGADPASARARQRLAALLRRVLPDAYLPALERALLECLTAADVQPQDVAAVAASQICHKLHLDRPQSDAAVLAERLAAEPLLAQLLERTVNVDATLERRLVRVREHLLSSPDPFRAPDAAATRRLLAALATQCFVNEHVWPESDAEAELVAKLRARLEDAARGGALGAGEQWALARLAMYSAPADLAAAETLARLPSADWQPELRALATLTLAEPLEERALAGELEPLADIADATSAAVRAQYESHPYPRWTALPEREPVAYRAWLERRFPHAELGGFPDSGVEVLVAGCGTGQEAVAAARARTGARVLGLDLSRRSLAYARRMARKLGVENVGFVHGDLLDLPRLGRRFHVIESSGVLHHMTDPLRGWRTLRECLHPGGVMKIGLYSERARRDVALARSIIAEQGLGVDAADIRAFRARVLSAPPGETLARLAASDDLYTLSACRDLLFHVHEQSFTIPALAGALAELGLELLGFELSDPEWVRRYRASCPDDVAMTDLACWDRFEAGHPDAFAAMYVFWCRAR